MNDTHRRVEWVKVSSSIDNAPIVASALASLGMFPKVTPCEPGRMDVWVCLEQAPDAKRLLGKTPGVGWAEADPFLNQRLLAMYSPTKSEH